MRNSYCFTLLCFLPFSYTIEFVLHWDYNFNCSIIIAKKVHWWIFIFIFKTIHHVSLCQVRMRLPTLALKPRGNITRNPKQGYQWLQKKDFCPPKCLTEQVIFPVHDRNSARLDCYNPVTNVVFLVLEWWGFESLTHPFRPQYRAVHLFLRDRSNLATTTQNFYVVTRIFYVNRNGLHCYQCYCSHMTARKSDKNTSLSSSANGPFIL